MTGRLPFHFSIAGEQPTARAAWTGDRHRGHVAPAAAAAVAAPEKKRRRARGERFVPPQKQKKIG